jgi:hypothetical protein
MEYPFLFGKILDLRVNGDSLLLLGAGNSGSVCQRAPVGGITIPTTKLEILTPYLALVGLIVVVSTVYVIKRRKD